MKVCILTYPLHSNFGCIMQAWALQQAIKKLGHVPTTINIRPYKGSLKGRVYRYCKGVVQKSIRNKGICLNPNKRNQYLDTNINRYTESFIAKNLSLTPLIKNWNKHNLKKATKDYEAFIVGSDQVWRKQYVRQIGLFFFSFISPKRPRFSYAASFGINKMDYSKREIYQCRKLINQFKAVSVRENDAVELCKTNFGINAIQVVDPTLLMNKEDYLTLISIDETSNIIPQKPFLLAYILDANDKKSQIDAYARTKELEVLYIKPEDIPSDIDITKDLTSYIYPSMSTWLKAFDSASEIITDSFHGTVFSIIFEKPFLALQNNNRGNSRLHSLLNGLGLSRQLVTDLNDGIFDLSIIWDDVTKLKEKLRERAFIFLKKNLK